MKKMSKKRQKAAADDEVEVLSPQQWQSSLRKKKSVKQMNHFEDVTCEICVENKKVYELIRLKNCTHSFCSDCIVKYITMKIESNAIGPTITCPTGSDCSGAMEFEAYRTIIPKEVSDQWDDKLTESLIDVSQRFYCPFKDCSAMLVNEGGGGDIIRESECPNCRRLFCAKCRVPWHPLASCEELQRMNLDERGNEDLMVRDLAGRKKWKRCPHCRFYVEKISGCSSVVCRCGRNFYYH